MRFFATKGDVSPDTEPLEAAIHSIFGFIERTAERTDTGITWEKINYKNEPHHSISVFNGVGGISFFLVDYYRRYGNPVALELSQGGALIGAPIYRGSILNVDCISARLGSRQPPCIARLRCMNQPLR